MEWNEFVTFFNDKYLVGEEIYNVLKDKRPENTDIIICSAQLGDTVWLAAYAEAYKAKNNCRLMYVTKTSQVSIINKYPAVDAVFDITPAEMEALELYIVRNELWNQNHIVLGNHREFILVNKESYALSLYLEDFPDICVERKAILGLGADIEPSKMQKNKPFDEKKKEEYSNAVVLMPSANTFKGIDIDFWQRLAKHISEDLHKKVYTNYNGLKTEVMIPGTSPLASSLDELQELSQYIDLFIGLRSGICDYLTACNANLAIIYSEQWTDKGNGVYEFPSNPQALGDNTIYNFAYDKEKENQLIMELGNLLKKEDVKESGDNNIDTLVVITPKDCERLLPLYPRLVANIDFGTIFFVGTDEVKSVIDGSSLDESRVSFINEDSIINFDKVHACMTKKMETLLAGRALPRGITGWYYQQFLKMQYALKCENEYYMVWDGDTIPCHKISMFQEESGKPYLDLKHEYHPEYFETLGKILPGFGKVIERSFISEHMLINTKVMRELIEEIEKNEAIEGNSFWEKIIEAIPAEMIQDSAFSEFETYGTFVALRHSSMYKLREWHSFRQGGTFYSIDTISDRDFDWLSKDFDAISFEKGHSVREDNKNLFDNPYYQEKLTARQMLEAAQLEYKEGYKETWGDSESSAVNEHTGMYSGSDGIVIEDRLKYLSKDTYKEYEKLGDDLVGKNASQAYLCYENAHFLCDDTEAKTRLENKKKELASNNAIKVKKTAIVILSYNQLFLMQRCIESIYNNCNPNDYLLVIFDNGSKDGSAEWLSEWGENHDEAMVILNETNLGFSGGNNAACQYISDDYDVFFLNNDTRVPANALFWLRMGLYAADDIGAVGAVQNYADADQIHEVEFNDPEEYVKHGAEFNVYMKNPLEEQSKLCGFALLVKKEAWNETGGFDERFNPGYVEDDDICLHIRYLGYRTMVCHNSFIYHVGSQSFIRVENPHELFVKHRKIVIEKWGFDSTLYAGMSRNEYNFIMSLADKGYTEESHFSLVHVGSGCGNMLGHIHYLYPNADVCGVEENEAARNFAISCIPVYPSVEALPKRLEEYDVVARGLG